jgi:hypothetical protein
MRIVPGGIVRDPVWMVPVDRQSSPTFGFIDHLQVLEDHPIAMPVDEDKGVDLLPIDLHHDAEEGGAIVEDRDSVEPPVSGEALGHPDEITRLH